MKRKEFIRLSVPALVLLANGQLTLANNYYLTEEHKRKVKLRFAVASDGHYGQPKTEYAAFHERLVSRVNEEHSRHAFSFCMINGDVVHDDKSHYPAVKKALDQLKPKYYVSQGNHDHVTPAEWQQIWSMPVNLDFTIGDNAFLIATTSDEKGTYLCPDVNWISQKLDEHAGKDNVFIFMHINPGKLSTHAVDCPALFDVFAKHKNIRAVFNGHDHDEEGVKTKNNIPFVYDAHFGGNWGTPYRGFRVVELMKDNSVVTYILDPVNRINETKLDG